MKPLLLLVEDDLVEARRLESAASHLGYECIVATDGDAALALLERTAFDVVLLDLVLPELDGMGVLGQMRRRGIEVPVVAAVTVEGLDAAASAIRAGARDFVVKPAGALRLNVALANAMALARAQGAAATRAAATMEQPAARAVPDEPEFLDPRGHVRPLEEIEAKAIRLACAHYGGRLTEAARRLGIGRSTLYRKLARLGLPLPADAAPAHHLEPMAPHIVAAE